jgi:hypothetical protein
MFNIQPTTLTAEELCRYAQLATDKNESVPLAWQQALITHLQTSLDSLAAVGATTELHFY